MAAANREFRIKRRPLLLRDTISLLLLLAALCIAGWGVYMVVGTYAKKTTSAPIPEVFASPEERQSAEGKDESSRSSSLIDAHRVADDEPRVISAQAIDMRARVLPMGTNPDGSMQAPINIFDSGWYVGSAKPGEKGAVVIDGHASGPTREGLFAYIDTLKLGQTITLERGDGRVFTYEVVAVETIDLENVDMERFLKPYEGSDEGLNLITCAGAWQAEKNTYNQRAMVFAKRV